MVSAVPGLLGWRWQRWQERDRDDVLRGQYHLGASPFLGSSRFRMGVADLLLSLAWESETPQGTVRHRDHLFARAADIEKDPLPELLQAGLRAAAAGQTVEAAVELDDLVLRPGAAAATLPRVAFAGRRPDGAPLTPKFGRFYPAAWFPDADRRGWMPLVRCTAASDTGVAVEAGHPLAGHSLSLAAKVVGTLDDSGDENRPAIDWLGDLVSGPGMQACWQGEATDFLEAESYARPDEAPDPQFYAPPRIVAHLDGRAQQTVGAIYRHIIPTDGRVLDLMSSVHSNLAGDQRFGALYGLGLNPQEMAENPRLDGAAIADLNTDRAIPFADRSFDAAICTVSIDYLIDPVRTVAEVARVLRPGGRFAVTFSNRWFPPKVTRVWTELHPFEQMALVVRYFEAAGGFTELETVSFRGYPRPMDDPYYRQMSTSDPVFAVVGRARKE